MARAYSHLADSATMKKLHAHNSRNTYIIAGIRKAVPTDGFTPVLGYLRPLACEPELTCEPADERPPPEPLDACEL